MELTELLSKDGFETCILKGQGNAVMYPNPILRTSGDIDVWVLPKLKIENGKWRIREIVRYVRKRNLGAKACYHHVEYGEFKGVEVEVHYRPSFMNSFIANRKLQCWVDEHKDEQFQHYVSLPGGVGLICMPTWEFNVVYQLSHIYNHLLHEGIGLKQMVDYYYLLKTGNNNQLNSELRVTLQQLNLYKIAGAVMYVLNEVLGLEDKYLIAQKDEKRGKVLFAEIMKGGNFGFYNTDNQKANSAIQKNLQRIKRDIRMMRFFPSECLWEPVFRIYHFFWRLAH